VDVIPFQSPRITGPILPFMMLQNDHLAFLVELMSLLEKLVAVIRMPFHFLHFLVGKFRGLVDDRQVDADLPQIMQKESPAEGVHVMCVRSLEEELGQ